MGSQKGKVAEREVAKLFCAWWQRVEPGCSFVRTPLSGGWSSPQVRVEYRACADLMTTATRFPFGVEVKRREGISLDWLREGKPSPAWDWWRQAQRQASEAKLAPMLVFRRSREPWLAMLPIERTSEWLTKLLDMGQRWSKEVDGCNVCWPPAEMSWPRSDLRGRKVGAHPVVYELARLLTLPPHLFATGQG